MRRAFLLLSFSALLLAGCSVKEDPLPIPELPRALSAWQDDAPFGQAAANFEARTTRDFERTLQDRYPTAKRVGGDAIDAANEAAVVAHFARHFAGLGWAPVTIAGVPSGGSVYAWSKGDRLFAVQIVAPYPDGKLKLVGYYGVGFETRKSV